jgi:hypothetical protein
MSASEIDELGHVDYLVVEFPPASVVWENSWTAPFASATREAGGQLIAAGRTPTQAIAASIAAEVAAPGEGE